MKTFKLQCIFQSQVWVIFDCDWVDFIQFLMDQYEYTDDEMMDNRVGGQMIHVKYQRKDYYFAWFDSKSKDPIRKLLTINHELDHMVNKIYYEIGCEYMDETNEELYVYLKDNFQAQVYSILKMKVEFPSIRVYKEKKKKKKNVRRRK